MQVTLQRRMEILPLAGKPKNMVGVAGGVMLKSVSKQRFPDSGGTRVCPWQNVSTSLPTMHIHADYAGRISRI